MINSLKRLFQKENRQTHNSNKIIKYKNSGLDDSLALELSDKLLELMVKEKLYRNPELTLELLSSHLQTTRHNTSQIINQYYNKSYSDFINDFRINDAKEIIKKSKDIKINKLLFDLGFNSKSNFYNAFKRRLNMTPSQFKIAQREDNEPLIFSYTE